MLLKDILTFNKDNYFNGAVQADWFYDKEKCRAVANSYVFHGPKYYGVSSVEVNSGNNRLIDTVSYVNRISDKLSIEDGNRSIMTIAGYGTGKSHLAVTLGALFSGHDSMLRKSILNKIIDVDRSLGEKIQKQLTSRNLVLVLNGMKNFNLDYEMLQAAKRAVALHGISTDIFVKLSKAYETARHFVANTYDLLRNEYNTAFGNKTDKNYIIDNIEKKSVYEKVNEIYKTINASYIMWEQSISAGEVLDFLVENLCDNGNHFNKVIVLFDEFGRYMEYAAANPSTAGDAAFQQIFESIQNAKGKIIFDAFIQADLEVYQARIDKSSNMVRYVGRYNNSEKIYLSANFETILANLIQVKDSAGFEKYVSKPFEGKIKDYNEKIQRNLIRWSKEAKNKYVWEDVNTFLNVIALGCYPLHPFTVWVLSSLSSRLQQRSAMVFAEEMFEKSGNSEINFGKHWYVYPTEIMNTGMYYELLDSEEKDLRSDSQYTLLYREILTKIGDRISDDEKKTLQAIVLLNLVRYEFLDKNDAEIAISYFAGINQNNIKLSLRSLEEMHGVTTYDESISRFSLIAEATGKNEFRRAMMVRKTLFKQEIGIGDYDEEEASIMELNRPIRTSFPVEHSISSTEWRFEKRIINIKEFNADYIKKLRDDISRGYANGRYRGVLVYLYATNGGDKLITAVNKLYLKEGLNNECIVLNLINDPDGEIIDIFKEKRILQSFSANDKQRFDRFITERIKKLNILLSKKFVIFTKDRYIFGLKGITRSGVSLRMVCNKKFEDIYNKAISFSFDGFEKKIDNKIKRYFVTVCRALLDGSIENKQEYYALDPQYKTRIKSSIGISSKSSWRLYDEEACKICEPLNDDVKHIMTEIQNNTLLQGRLSIGRIFKKFFDVPYGLNEYSLILLIVCFMAKNREHINLFVKDKKTSLTVFASRIFSEKNSTIKIDLNELLTAQLEVVEKRENSVEYLLKRARENVFTENCQQLLDEIENDLEGEMLTDREKGEVETVKFFLKDGITLNNSMYEKLDDARGLIKDIKTKFSVTKAGSLLEKLYIGSDKIDDSKPFFYSNNYKEQCSSVREEAKKIIKAQLYPYIENYLCAVTQLSQMSNSFKNAAAIYAKHGLAKEATYIKESIPAIQKRVMALKKYEDKIGELIKFASECKKMSSMSFKEILRRKNEADVWIDFLNSLKELSMSTKREYYDIIKDAADALEKKQSELEKQLKEIYARMKLIKDIESLRRLTYDIEQFLLLQPKSTDEAKLKNCLDLANLFTDEFGSKCESRDDLDLLRASLSRNFKRTYLEGLARQYYQDYRTRLDEMEKSWLENYVYGVESNISFMTAEQCTLWQNETNIIPLYLTAKGKERYIRLRTKVNKRITECRVQGAVAMFNSLTDAEKKEFLSLIAEVIKC